MTRPAITFDGKVDKPFTMRYGVYCLDTDDGIWHLQIDTNSSVNASQVYGVRSDEYTTIVVRRISHSGFEVILKSQ